MVETAPPTASQAEVPDRPTAERTAADRRARVALVLLVLLANLPGLGRPEIDHEEGRRLLAASAMVEGAGWVEPTIWGRSYLAKPPFFYWTVAASGSALGALGMDGWRTHYEGVEPLAVDPRPGSPAEVLAGRAPISPLALRLPSMLAALAIVLTVFEVTRRHASRAAAATAGGCVALAPNLLSKAVLGEIELVLVALVGAGVLAAWRGLRTGVGSAALGGLLIGLATLAKGPVALGFGLVPIWLAAFGLADVAPGVPRRVRLARAAVCSLVGLGVPGLWLVLLLAGSERADAAGGTWARELARGGTGGLEVYLRDRLRLVTGLAAGWLPASLLAAVGWRRWSASPLTRMAALALIAGLLLMLVWPGTRARYALPLLPFAAILAGAAVENPGAAVAALARGLARLGIWLGATVALGLPLLAGLGALHAGDDPVDPGDPLVIGVVLGLLAAVAVLLWRTRRALGAVSPARALALAGAALLAARVAERTLLEPLGAHRHLRVASAAYLVERAGELEGPLSIGFWGEFNNVCYAGLPLRWVDGPEQVPMGGLLVLHAGGDPAPEGSATAWERVVGPDGVDEETGRPRWSFAGEPVALPERCELRHLAVWRRLR